MLIEIFFISIMTYISYKFKIEKKQEFELSLLDKLEDIADNIDSRDSINTAIKKIIKDKTYKTSKYL
ncbi:MAG: hypothetical protein K0B02_00120 [DPANN group archaeon]|nr:hypothetical protein [DPANN group archaeon]